MDLQQTAIGILNMNMFLALRFFGNQNFWGTHLFVFSHISCCHQIRLFGRLRVSTILNHSYAFEVDMSGWFLELNTSGNGRSRSHWGTIFIHPRSIQLKNSPYQILVDEFILGYRQFPPISQYQTIMRNCWWVLFIRIVLIQISEAAQASFKSVLLRRWKKQNNLNQFRGSNGTQWNWKVSETMKPWAKDCWLVSLPFWDRNCLVTKMNETKTLKKKKI